MDKTPLAPEYDAICWQCCLGINKDKTPLVPRCDDVWLRRNLTLACCSWFVMILTHCIHACGRGVCLLDPRVFGVGRRISLHSALGLLWWFAQEIKLLKAYYHFTSKETQEEQEGLPVHCRRSKLGLQSLLLLQNLSADCPWPSTRHFRCQGA